MSRDGPTLATRSNSRPSATRSGCAASTCALVAAALTVLTIAALPAIWQGGRRVESWTGLRKLFFTATVLIYTGFSVLLALNGALEPWNG